jgi:hypothetical protein
MNDILRYMEWKYLPVEDILRMCGTNKKMKEIYDDPETWRYLLKRDYKIESSTNDPK